MKDEKQHPEDRHPSDNHPQKEPYNPKETPKPPQVVDPQREEKGKDSGDASKEKRSSPTAGNEERPSEPATSSQGKKHLLSDDTDIDDETTI